MTQPLVRLTSADMSDLNAASERHGEAVWEDYSTTPRTLKHTGVCITCEGQEWPCDASLFRDALDRSEAEWDRAAMAVESAAAERLDAARALADELGRASLMRLLALWPHSFSVQPDGPGWRIDVSGEWGDIHESLADAIDAALAKWEASRG